MFVSTKDFVLFPGGSSPDEGGFISTAGNKGSSLSTPGTVTPSSEALDVVTELPSGPAAATIMSLVGTAGVSRGTEPNGNMMNMIPMYDPLGPNPDPNMSVPLLKQYQPTMLNGNANNPVATVGPATTVVSAQNLDDLYAKVSNINKICQRQLPMIVLSIYR